MRTYYFEEEVDDRSNVRKNYFSSKQENTADEVDAKRIRKYFENELTKK